MKHEVILPQVINVGGMTISLKFNSKDDNELDAKSLWGDSSLALQRMRICSRACSQQMSQTFLHELLHLVDDVYNNHSLQEDAVCSISYGLHQVMEQLEVRFVRAKV